MTKKLQSFNVYTATSRVQPLMTLILSKDKYNKLVKFEFELMINTGFKPTTLECLPFEWPMADAKPVNPNLRFLLSDSSFRRLQRVSGHAAARE